MRAYINMNDPSARAYIVGDISPGVENGAWRWTNQKPTLKFHLKDTQNLKLVMDLSIAEVTLAKTGPVTITFLVNDRPLDKVTYSESGRRRFEKAVPADWLQPGDNLVSAEIDKVFVTQPDGKRLGFILTSAGFTR